MVDSLTRHYVLQVTVDAGHLEIRDIELTDDGEYICVASNVGGNATLSTIVDVQGRSQ